MTFVYTCVCVRSPNRVPTAYEVGQEFWITSLINFDYVSKQLEPFVVCADVRIWDAVIRI